MLGNDTGRSQASLSWDHGKRSGVSEASLSWDHGKRIVAAVISLLMAVVLVMPLGATATADETLVSVIVRQVEGSSTAANTIDTLGGDITTNLASINGFVADVPNDALDVLASLPGVASVTQNFSVTLHGAGWDTDKGPLNGTLEKVAINVVEADDAWDFGYTGQGVTIALVDTGVAPVDGVQTPGKLVNGPDLSFDSQSKKSNPDGYGHGTHLAGIMAGRASDAPADIDGNTAKKHFLGVAPDAQVLNMKVGAANGAVDISQVLASIDWVVQHQNDNGMNVRVLNLSFGTDSTQSYMVDPLAFAVELAWNNGIVVVVASGNDGAQNHMRSPATDPFVIAVGAVNDYGSARSGDDVVASFSNCGSSRRHVDVLAPGKSIVSLLAPGSDAATHTKAIVDGSYIKGSGTSQAAAAVSGAAAVILEQHPNYTPDQVKALLMQTATPISASTQCQGAGVINLEEAITAAPMPRFTQNYATSNGLGSLEAARGNIHVENAAGDVLGGEVDIMGNDWTTSGWGTSGWGTSLWSGGDWNGATWTSSGWGTSGWGTSGWGTSGWGTSGWGGSQWATSGWGTSGWGTSGWGGVGYN